MWWGFRRSGGITGARSAWTSSSTCRAKPGMKACPGPTKHHERAHYGDALLSRLPVLEVRSMDLSLPHREPRGAIDADIQVGDKVVRVIVAHLGLDPWERMPRSPACSIRWSAALSARPSSWATSTSGGPARPGSSG